jgi:hypothetical protein
VAKTSKTTTPSARRAKKTGRKPVKTATLQAAFRLNQSTLDFNSEMRASIGCVSNIETKGFGNVGSDGATEMKRHR